MDVSSVSSSISSALASVQPSPSRIRQSEQDQAALQARPAPQSQDPQGAQGSEQAQRVAAVDQGQESARAQADNNRPTVNVNGQTVGTVINTTA